MATKSDLKTQLISTFNAVVSASGTSGEAGLNLREVINKDHTLYQVYVNVDTSGNTRTGLGGRDTISIIDDGITTTNRFTIRMVSSAHKTKQNTNIIFETAISSGEFTAMETPFLVILEAYRSDVYQNSIDALIALEAGMINRLF